MAHLPTTDLQLGVYNQPSVKVKGDAGVGFVCSLLGVLTVKVFSAKSPEVALRYGTMGSAAIFIIAAYFLISLLGISPGVWVAVFSGAVGGTIVGLVTEYYTGGAPVRKIAEGGETGPATVMIIGLATGMSRG